VSVEHNGLLVVGPPRSGRSTALRRVARSLVANGYDVWTVGVDGVGGPGRHAPAKADPMLELLEDFASMCESSAAERPLILVIDDADRYDQSALPAVYERILKTEHSRLIGALELRNLTGYTQNTMLLELRREPTVLLLRPESAGDVLQLTGVRAQLRPGLKLVAGRGVLIKDREPVLLQVATA
jgi:S-DNA-T family DNA segregation ATPase FtsK/SpoIIIE